MGVDIHRMIRRTNISLWRWLLLLAYAFISVSGWIRMGSSISNWYWLNEAGIQPGPFYLVVTGALWGLVGLAAFGWVFLQIPKWRKAGMWAVWFFVLTYWIDRLIVANPEGVLSNTLFALFVTVLGTGYSALVLEAWNVRSRIRRMDGDGQKEERSRN